MNIAMTLLLFTQVMAPGPANMSYIACMTTSASAILGTQPSRADYRRHLSTVCAHERAALRRVVVRKRIGEGRTQRLAERDADEFFAVIETQMLDLQPISAR